MPSSSYCWRQWGLRVEFSQRGHAVTQQVPGNARLPEQESLPPPSTAACWYQVLGELGKRPHHWGVVKNRLQKQESAKCGFVTDVIKAVIARKWADICKSMIHQQMKDSPVKEVFIQHLYLGDCSKKTNQNPAAFKQGLEFAVIMYRVTHCSWLCLALL